SRRAQGLDGEARCWTGRRYCVRPRFLRRLARTASAASGAARRRRLLVGFLLLSVSLLWPWLVLAGLGFFHGINPAMGWLFAVALGLNRKSQRIVFLSLIPIALGHALAIATVVAVVLALGIIIDLSSLALISGLALIAWAA